MFLKNKQQVKKLEDMVKNLNMEVDCLRKEVFLLNNPKIPNGAKVSFKEIGDMQQTRVGIVSKSNCIQSGRDFFGSKTYRIKYTIIVGHDIFTETYNVELLPDTHNENTNTNL